MMKRAGRREEGARQGGRPYKGKEGKRQQRRRQRGQTPAVKLLMVWKPSFS
jgi:hypothetical protein